MQPAFAFDNKSGSTPNRSAVAVEWMSDMQRTRRWWLIVIGLVAALIYRRWQSRCLGHGSDSDGWQCNSRRLCNGHRSGHFNSAAEAWHRIIEGGSTLVTTVGGVREPDFWYS